MKVSIWLVLLTAIGTGMASIGGYVGLSDYFSARPSVFLNVVDVAVVPRKPKVPQIASLLTRLDLIEGRHREYTSVDIIELINEFKGIDESGATDVLDSFRGRLTNVIDIFSERRPSLESLASHLRTVADSLSGFETGREELIEKLENLEMTYALVTGDSILSLRDNLKQQSDEDFDSDQQRGKLDNLADTFKDVSSNMEALISDLQKVRDDAEMKSDEKESHFEVEVVFENRSRYKNDIYRKAMIAVRHGNDNNVQYFELDLLGEGRLAEYSLERKTFQSRPAEDMDLKKRELIGEFNHKANNFKCKIGIFDLHRNIWTTEERGCKDDGVDLENLKSELEPS